MEIVWLKEESREWSDTGERVHSIIKKGMENNPDQTKEETNVDFGEDTTQNEQEPTLESLDKLAESIDAEQSDDLKKVKEMAAEVRIACNLDM